MAVATVFKSREDISPDWVTYIEVEADALSRLSDYEIENYADRELYNPEVQSFFKGLERRWWGRLFACAVPLAGGYLSFYEDE